MANVAFIYVHRQPRQYRLGPRKIAYRCLCSAIPSEPGLHLCKKCKAAVEAGAAIRIPYTQEFRGAGRIQIWKKYGARGGWNGILYGKEIGECASRDALTSRVKQLINVRANEEARLASVETGKG